MLSAVPRYELIVFDFDGTLADSRDWAIEGLRGAAAKFGFRTAGPEEIEMLRGRTTQELTRYLEIPLWKVPQITAYMRARMAEDAHKIRLFPGVPETLAALARAGVRLAIVSSNSEHNVRRILGPEQVAHIQDFSCGTSIFGKARKLRALIRRSRIAPGKTLCIGDETRDIEAARAVGADSAGVAWGYATPEALARCGPTLMFSSFSDAVDAIVAAA